MNPVSRLSRPIATLVAGALMCAAPHVSTQANDPRDEPIAFHLQFPAADSSSCRIAHEDAPRLLAETQADLDARVIAAAKDYVAQTSARTSPARAWSDLAVALLLSGDPAGAAWSELNGLAVEWSAQGAQDEGVYLLDIDKRDDARAFLDCAYALGDRSPYLFEALSVLYHQLGNSALARQNISLARELAPNDLPIGVEQVIAGTGAPPPPAANQSPKDPLDTAMGRLRRHAQRVVNLLALASADYDRIEGRTDGFRARQLAVTDAEIDSFVRSAEQTYARARPTRDEYRRLAGKDYTEDRYGRYAASQYDAAVLNCVESYLQITSVMFQHLSLENLSAAENVTFWAHTLYRSPQSFADEINAASVANGGPAEILGIGNNTRLDTAASLRYQAQVTEANRKYTGPSLANQAALCNALTAAYEEFERDVQNNFNRAAHHFDEIAQERLTWGESQLLDARAYALETYALLRAARPTGRNGTYATLLRSLLDPDDPTGLVAADDKNKTDMFQRDQAAVTDELTSEKQSLAYCASVRAAYLEQLEKEDYEKYLEYLKDHMKDDFEVGYDATASCKFSVGPFSISADDTGKVTDTVTLKWKDAVDGLDAKAKANVGINGNFVGASVGLGKELEGFPPFTGDADGTIAVKPNPQTGRWDVNIAVDGRLGIGFKKRTEMLGRPVSFGLACYPGSVSAEFHARAFYDHAIEYIQAAAAGHK